jgi:flagellar hook-associated protein 2
MSSSSSGVVSIASSTSAGAAGGSVINVSSLVSQLVGATQTPQQNLINTQQQAVTTQISALGTLKSALSTFQQSLTALATPSAFAAVYANSSNTTAFGATAASGATPGNYSVSVTQLASAQQLLSGKFTGGAAATIGTGTLQVSLGSSSFSVAITSSDNTLTGIASAINSASNNPGVTATVVQGTDGAHLLLSSSQTGAANTITVSETDSGGALSALTYDGSTSNTNYGVQTKAQDAEYSIAGVAASSTGNTVSDAIPGVTLTLSGLTTTTTGTGASATTTDTPATLTVTSNTAQIESNVNSFVSAYNTLIQSFNSLGGYDSTTKTAGPMMGNGLLSSLESQIKSAMFGIANTGSSTYDSLASVGITSNSDGTLTANSATLASALSSNFTAVSNLFSGAGGVASSLNTQITNDLGSGGAIAQDSTSLQKQSTALDTQTTQLTAQMTALTASLTQQYSALNSLLSSLQTTSAYLTQAFAALPSNQSSTGK